jgi:hypothetical protein
VKKLLLIIGLSLTAIAGTSYLQGCKKCECRDVSNPECENYDPCFGQTEVKADFIIGEMNTFMPVNGDDNFVNADSIFRTPAYEYDGGNFNTYQSYLGFKCLTQGAKTTWKLGAETITESFFARFFKNGLVSGKYKVSLIVEKEPNKRCFPKDDGIDTLEKNFYFMPNYELPIMGAYKVLFEDDKDSTIVQIRPWLFEWNGTPGRNFKMRNEKGLGALVLINFRKLNDTLDTGPGGHCTYTGHNIQFGDESDVDYAPQKGRVKLIHNTISAEYFAYYEPKRTYRQYKFKGRKIQ